MNKKVKKIVIALGLFTAISIVGNITNTLSIFNTCDSGAGWGVVYKECDCLGAEVTLENNLAADGFYQTMCLGIGLYK